MNSASTAASTAHAASRRELQSVQTRSHELARWPHGSSLHVKPYCTPRDHPCLGCRMLACAALLFVEADCGMSRSDLTLIRWQVTRHGRENARSVLRRTGSKTTQCGTKSCRMARSLACHDANGMSMVVSVFGCQRCETYMHAHANLSAHIHAYAN